MAGNTVTATPASASPVVGPARVRAYRRLVAVGLRSPAVWLSVPVVVAMDLVIALGHQAPWRGEIAFLVEWVAPVIMLFAPVLAGVGAWLAREDNALDRSGMLRACVDGRLHAAVRIATGAGLPAATHLVVLFVLGGVSLTTARIGGWAVGPLLIQLFAFPAFVALGYLVGRIVDHLTSPLLAAAIALLAAYTDYGNYRWPLGLMSDGGTGPFVGQSVDHLAVAGRLAFCAAMTGLAVLAATWPFAATPARWLRVGALALLGVLAVSVVQARPQIWVVSTDPPVADQCAGERPRICGVPAYAGLVGRAARIADRAAALLRSSGATGLPDSYVGWWPTAPSPADTVDIVQPGTAYRPPSADDIARDVIAPKHCSQWFSGADLDREGAAEQIVLTWLVDQDRSLAGGRPVTPAGADVDGFSRRSPQQQRGRVAALATALATCQFADLPRPGSPM